MNKAQIGQTAGQIWQILDTKGEVSLTQLPRLLKLTSDLTYQAVGWLAREDKVEYNTKAGKIYVSLAEKERLVSKVGH